jgi:hypothetical protein
MNERSIILREWKSREGLAVVPKSNATRFTDFLMGKFDAVAAFVFKWTNF